MNLERLPGLNMDAESHRRVSFRVASALCLPCLAGSALFLVFLLCKEVSPDFQLPSLLLVPLLIGILGLLTPMGIAYLILAQVLLLHAWTQRAFRSRASLLFGFYNLSLLFCAGYVAWWYVTGQKMDL